MSYVYGLYVYKRCGGSILALLICPDCGGKVSNRAECCPHCGCPASYIIDTMESRTNSQSEPDMRDFEIVGTVLLRYHGTSSVVRVPDGITEIAEGAFAYNESITKLLASDCLLSICENAFSHCVNLEYLNLPDTVEKIGDYAFERCSSLQCIASPMVDGDDPEIISYYELGRNCVVIPESVCEIGGHAFEDCCRIQRICMQENIQIVGVNAFANCTSLREVYIFRYDSLYLCSFAFYNCRNLLTGRIDAKEIFYDQFCFANCKQLSRLTFWGIPEMQIQTYAFYGCRDLDQVMRDRIAKALVKAIPSSAPHNTVVIDGWNLREGAGGWIIDRQIKKIKGKLVIPNIIGSKKIIGIGGDAFGWMQYDLEEVYISEGITFIEDAIDVIDEKTGKIVFSCGAFENCNNLKNVVFPQTLVYIGSSAFSGTSLQELHFPDKLRKIGAYAFSTGSKNLKKIKFPNSLREIGEYAFSGQYSMKIENFPTSLRYIENYAFAASDSYVSWLKKGDEKGNAAARYHFSIVQKDTNAAMALLKKSAEQGYMIAQYEVGCLYEKYGDHQTAMVSFEKAAAQGYIAAQIHCGEIYTRPGATKASKLKGRYWYQKAAAKLPQDDTLQLRCAQLFMDKNLDQDPIQAYYYLSNAAKLGNIKAQRILKTIIL